MALGAITAPAVPAIGSANQVINNTGVTVMVVALGTTGSALGVGIGQAGATLTANVVTTVALAGSAAVVTVLLMPGQAIAFFTVTAASWAWFSLE